MKKVLIVIIASDLSAGGGGRETWLKNFLNSSIICSKYNELHVICYGSKGHDSLLFNTGVSVHWNMSNGRLPLLRFIFHVRNSLNNILDELSEFSIISCGSWSELLALNLSGVGNEKNVIKICWLRSIVIRELSRYYNALLIPLCHKIELKLLSKMDLVISNGFDTHDYYLNHGINSVVIPNSIHVDEFKVNKAEKPIILYCGRISIEKGIREFVAAIEILLRSRNDFEVIIIGSGLVELLKPIIKSDQVKYLGQLSGDNLLKEISRASISAHLTLSGRLGGAGISHSLLESMCLGHLIVSWDSPIFNQVIGSENFYMAQESSISDLIIKINDAIELVQSSDFGDLRLLMNSFGRNYDFKNHVSSYIKLIDKKLK